MVVLGAEGECGTWATVLTGPAGFAEALDQTTVVLSTLPPEDDPLRAAFDEERDCGLVALDAGARRRVRVNGRMRREGGHLVLRAQQVFRNCPKYIQRRTLLPDGPATASRVTAGTSLTTAQQAWITAADSFFVATRSARHGADVNHRGGQPGFVTVTGPRELTWPDYKGNSFYMTFGNLELDPSCGLVFLDWRSGHTLQVSGRARVDWEDCSAPGAKRAVRFTVERVVQTENATTLRWRFIEYSPLNPPIHPVAAPPRTSGRTAL